MILFKDIYNKSINLFDDPEINEAYMNNIIRFEKLMYPFLINGLSLFSNPTAIVWDLLDRTEPSGEMEILSGDEVVNGEFDLSSTPVEGSDFVVMINGVQDRGATVRVNDKGKYIVTLSQEVKSEDEVSAEWYFGGQFNTDFSKAATSKVPAGIIAERVQQILARALAVEWAEQERDFLLDIKNVLTDTDFRIYSPANSIRAKTEWVRQLQYDLDTMQTKLGWDLYSVSRNAGGYYRG